MDVVVTGASGFLGARVVQALRSQISGMEIRAVARTPGAGILQLQDYADAPPGDILIHLAEDGNRARVNAMGRAYSDKSLGTLERLLEKRYEKVLYASSAVLYGDRESHPHNTSDPIEVVDTYTDVKRRSELLVLEHPRSLVLRLGNLYGPKMSSANVLSRILGQLNHSGPLQVWDTSPVRDFLWVDDAAVAIRCMVETEGRFGVVNLGSGQAVAIEHLVRLALELSGQMMRPVETSNLEGGTSILALDIEETKRVWGWQPQMALRDGLRQLIEDRMC